MSKIIKLITLSAFIAGCAASTSGTAPDATPTTTFTVSGQITFDYVPTENTVTGAANRLKYADKAARPARRVTVQAVSGSTVVATTTTDDLGNYSFSVTASSVIIRALAASTVVANTTDATLPNNCSGATWDVRIVDNFTSLAASNTNPSLRPQYSVSSSTPLTSTTTGVNLNAAITTNGVNYTNRAGAPFNILDDIITEMELVCQGSANVTFPLLYVNWSSGNTANAGNRYDGDITTSFFTTEDYTGLPDTGNIYILGEENVDTDELDKHVIAHEYGHYLEEKIFRSDSIGGSHSTSDSLDPRVAFGEGYGNAISAMTYNDTVYVDTSGANQGSGFTINTNTAPAGDDRGVYSETSMQHLLWKLYENRDGTANSGSFDRIYNIMKNFQRTTTAFTTGLSFAAYYNQVYGGAAESLQVLWGTTLSTAYNALCSGACTGTGDTADPFDVDNDIGIGYNGAGRKYPQGTGAAQTAAFWRLYTPLTISVNSSGTVSQGGYGAVSNKFGNVKWFSYTAASTATHHVTLNSAGCGHNLFVYSLNNSTLGAAGCSAAAAIALTNGTTYIFTVNGTVDTTAYTIQVAP